MTRSPWPLTPLELATGIVFGLDDSRLDVPVLAPEAAIEAVVREPLATPPCLVAFSGGRDSSMLLAAATEVSRREGLPPPIPATFRAPSDLSMTETEWQDRIVRALGLQDWIRIDVFDDLDALGKKATELLRAVGLYWPFNLHTHALLAEQARGGSLMTGAGGDELFTPATHGPSLHNLLTAQGTSPRQAVRLFANILPHSLRIHAMRRRWQSEPFPWLTERGHTELVETTLEQRSREPAGWGASRGHWWRHRYVRALKANLDAVGASYGVSVVSPFLDQAVVKAVAHAGRRAGFRSRGEAMTALVPDYCPAGIASRTTKAWGTSVFLGERSRAFMKKWTGEGNNPRLVDSNALQREWYSDSPDPHSFTLLQSLWIRSKGLSSEQADR